MGADPASSEAYAKIKRNLLKRKSLQLKLNGDEFIFAYSNNWYQADCMFYVKCFPFRLCYRTNAFAFWKEKLHVILSAVQVHKT